jgi:hypothetical protein
MARTATAVMSDLREQLQEELARRVGELILR